MNNTQETQSDNYTIPPLTDELVYQIIFCMEDQSSNYILDLRTGVPIATDLIPAEDKGNDERFLEHPSWRPSDGFRTMEKFVSSLRNPIYRDKLRSALARGKGVFREFKNVLKQEPAVERLWFYYKEREIKQKIYTWYEQQTEILYLKSLGEPEENIADLILSDFIITYDYDKWKDHIRKIGEERLETEFSGVGYPIEQLLFQECESYWNTFDDSWLMVCIESPTGEFAGFIGAAPIGIDDSSHIYTVKNLYVEPTFRGLGMFKLLIDTLCKKAAEVQTHRIIIELSGRARSLAPSLDRRGFALISERYSLDIAAWKDNQKPEF